MRDENCTRCKLNETAQFVCLLGDGPKPSEIMILGEAPGKREDESGRPFVGEAGKLLMKVLNSHGIKREDVYITNAVNCRPPENRTPKKNEIKACRYWYQKQFTRVKPKFVLLLGNVPLTQALDLKGIKKLRGKPIELDGVIYLPTYHPAFILRDPSQEETFNADIRLFAEIVEKGKIPREEGLNYKMVESEEEIPKMMKDLYGTVSLDIETTCLYPWAKEAVINTIGFGSSKKQWILPAAHSESKISKQAIIRVLNELEERVDNGELCFVTQNGKFDMLWIWVHYGIRLPIKFDTMMAHYMIDENKPHGLKYLSQAYFGALDYDCDMDTKLGKKGLKPLVFYQAHDLYYTRKLKFILSKQLDADPLVRQVFDHIIMACVNLFVEVEYDGVYIDLSQMDFVEKKLRKDKAEAEKSLSKYLPKGFENINWGSPKQVGELLFKELKIPIVEKTKAGAPSTSESVLKRIDHPMVEALLNLRSANQQLSFFIDGWKPFLDGNILHPSFKLHGTVTGRLSCEHPNLQQVPRDPLIRSLIGAPPGWELIEADLSQIELRIAAELSGDRILTEAYSTGIDVHWLTALRELERGAGMPELILRTASGLEDEKIKNYGDAIQILLKHGPDAAVKVDSAWKEIRKKAKAINFGYLYGMWWKKFKIYARDNYGVKVSDKEAEASREAFFALYRDLPEWHKRQKRFVRKNGYVRSLSGRKRRLPAATSYDDTPERREAERQAINSPVQSFANELNLMALIQLRKEFPRKVLKFCGTVHDAILMIARKDYVEKVYKRTLEIMSNPELLETLDIELGIPIEAEAKIGSWSKGVSLKEYLKEQHD